MTLFCTYVALVLFAGFSVFFANGGRNPAPQNPHKPMGGTLAQAVDDGIQNALSMVVFGLGILSFYYVKYLG